MAIGAAGDGRVQSQPAIARRLGNFREAHPHCRTVSKFVRFSWASVEVSIQRHGNIWRDGLLPQNTPAAAAKLRLLRITGVGDR